MPDKDLEKQVGNEDEKLLKQAREDFAYCRSYWRENYDEAAKRHGLHGRDSAKGILRGPCRDAMYLAR